MANDGKIRNHPRSLTFQCEVNRGKFEEGKEGCYNSETLTLDENIHAQFQLNVVLARGLFGCIEQYHPKLQLNTFPS